MRQDRGERSCWGWAPEITISLCALALLWVSPSLPRGAIVPESRAQSIGGSVEADNFEGGSSSGTESARGGMRDLALSAMSNLTHQGHTGTYPNGVAGFSFATTSCNVGDVDLEWRQAMDINHPVIVQNLYRIDNDRLEQIGSAWIKHGFFSTNSSDCGTCINPTNTALLGVGCSDTYGAGNNSDRNWLGPRDELNPYTGFWECAGSVFDGLDSDCIRENFNYAAGLDSTERRIEVKDSDLAVADAEFRYEGYYIISNGPELNVYDNIGWRGASITWNGLSWSTGDLGTMTSGPVIQSWGDERTTFSGGEGDVILAVKAWELAVGEFHYEYAVYNHNLDRQIRSISIAVDPTATVTNAGFGDLDGDAGNDWALSNGGGLLTWETEDFATNPDANTLKYGTTFNVWFDMDRIPVSSSATLGLYKPGAGGSLTEPITGPAVGPLDCNTNGTEDTLDILGGTSADCNSNGRPDECDVSAGLSLDCNTDVIPDECQLTNNDCNANFIPDDCDIDGGPSLDCQPNGVPDECEILLADCNVNGIPDDCDAAGKGVPDCQPNGIPDDCELFVEPSFTVYPIAVEPDLLIPEDSGAIGVEHTFDIGEHGIITDVDVDLKITHNWNSDLVVKVTHFGVSVVLIDRPGIPLTGNGFDDDGFDVILDDDAATAIEDFDGGGTLVTGTFSPNELLSAFNGMDKIGEWRIHLRDLTDAPPISNGLLTDWSLHIDDAGQPGEPDCNSNQIPDSCDPDSNGDNIIDDCIPVCVCGDFTGDGAVNLADFGLFAICFGTTGPTGPCPAELRFCTDLSADGAINLADFATFAFIFLQPPSGAPPNCLP